MPGDRVVLVEDGSVGIVRWSRNGRSAVNWVDEDPYEFGGSFVADERLRHENTRQGSAAGGEPLGFSEAVAFLTARIGSAVSVVILGRDAQGDGVVTQLTGVLRAIGPDPSDPEWGRSGPVMFGFEGQDNVFFLDPDAFLSGRSVGDGYLRVELTFGALEVAGPIQRPEWF